MSDYPNETMVEHSVFRYFKTQDGMVSYQYARRAYYDGPHADRVHLWRKDSDDQNVVRALGATILQHDLFEELTTIDLPWSPITKQRPGDLRYRPAQEMAIEFDMDQDQREWQMRTTVGREEVTFRFVPEGDSFKDWNEIVTQQIAFTKAPPREYCDTWKKLLRRTDAQREVSEIRNADGSITVSFQSEKTQEVSIRRFMKGNDGVYMLAYSVRPTLLDDEIYNLWGSIIADATLVPNPVRWRRR